MFIINLQVVEINLQVVGISLLGIAVCNEKIKFPLHLFIVNEKISIESQTKHRILSGH